MLKNSVGTYSTLTWGRNFAAMEQPTLPNLFYVSIELVTGSKFRDIFLGDNRDIFLAARHFSCLISSSCFKVQILGFKC